MLGFQLLVLFILLLVIPFYVGGIFSVVESGRGRRMFQWISGQFLVWLGIELIAVALIVRHDDLNKAMALFWAYIAAVICFALGVRICRHVREGKKVESSLTRLKKSSMLCKVLWGVFGVLLLCQLVQTVWSYYAVAMPEDATPFYVDSPFSMWVAFLARSSGMQPEMVEKVVLPVVFLCMSYGAFFLLGAKTFGRKAEYQPLFLVLLSVVAIVGEIMYREYVPSDWPFANSKTEIMMLGGVLFPYLLFLFVLFGWNFRNKKDT